ncbi:hypothetical protein LP419_35365 [Massilia sp. H-1]|nr:hypothetical protein LP419_35365 [Massilia sp. H-1]
MVTARGAAALPAARRPRYSKQPAQGLAAKLALISSMVAISFARLWSRWDIALSW